MNQTETNSWLGVMDAKEARLIAGQALRWARVALAVALVALVIAAVR